MSESTADSVTKLKNYMTLTAIMDIERSTRKAANSEKDWLVFAVRELSRVVAGKEKGQEQIWNNKYKPVWWDEEVKAITNSCDERFAWKNPTTNPKDRKRHLIIKYNILSKRLRSENKFPKDLEEEAELWESDRIKELLLLTKVVSITSNTHSTNSDMEEVFDSRNESSLKIPHISRTINRSKTIIVQTINYYQRLLNVSNAQTSDKSGLSEDFDQLTAAHNNLETSEPEIGICHKPLKLNVSKNCSKRNSLEAENFLPISPRLEKYHQNMNLSVVGCPEKDSSNLFNDLRGYQSGRMTSMNETLEKNNSADNFLNDTDMSITVVDFQSTANNFKTIERIQQGMSTHWQPLQDKIVVGTSLQENSLPKPCSTTSIGRTFSPQSLRYSTSRKTFKKKSLKSIKSNQKSDQQSCSKQAGPKTASFAVSFSSHSHRSSDISNKRGPATSRKIQNCTAYEDKTANIVDSNINKLSGTKCSSLSEDRFDVVVQDNAIKNKDVEKNTAKMFRKRKAGYVLGKTSGKRRKKSNSPAKNKVTTSNELKLFVDSFEIDANSDIFSESFENITFEEKIDLLKKNTLDAEAILSDFSHF